MDEPYRPPCILRLEGVTLRDYRSTEDLADERLLVDGGGDPEDPAPEDVLPFDEIPRVYTGNADWPLHSNLKCWECDRTFDDRPKFLPTYIRESEKSPIGLEIGVCGNMCTFNCVASWSDAKYAARPGKWDDEHWRVEDKLNLVYFLFTGRRITHIPRAPHKTERREFGGALDDDAFSRKLRSLDNFAGLRDHTPGTILPERLRPPLLPPVPEAERPQAVIASLRAWSTPAGLMAPRSGRPAEHEALQPPAPAAGLEATRPFAAPGSVWGVCGRPEGAPPQPRPSAPTQRRATAPAPAPVAVAPSTAAPVAVAPSTAPLSTAPSSTTPTRPPQTAPRPPQTAPRPPQTAPRPPKPPEAQQATQPQRLRPPPVVWPNSETKVAPSGAPAPAAKGPGPASARGGPRPGALEGRTLSAGTPPASQGALPLAREPLARASAAKARARPPKPQGAKAFAVAPPGPARNRERDRERDGADSGEDSVAIAVAADSAQNGIAANGHESRMETEALCCAVSEELALLLEGERTATQERGASGAAPAESFDELLATLGL